MTHQIRMKVYIAGPMTGLPDNNYPAFIRAENDLRNQGLLPLNPALNKASNWEGFMRRSLHQIAQSDALYMLKGWEGSKGARLEHQLALDLHLPIFYESGALPGWAAGSTANAAPKLEDSEQYRCQMAAIGTAAFGYWKEGDSIHPDYDTVPLRDVAKLYEKYEALLKQQSGLIHSCTKEVSPGVKEGWTPAKEQAELAEQAVKAAKDDHPSTGKDIPKVKSRYTVAVLDVFGRWVGVGNPSDDYGQIERDAVALSSAIFGLSVCVLPVAKPV